MADSRDAWPTAAMGEEHFRSLADSVPVLIWMSGPDKEGVYFNKTWLDFTGRSLAQERGQGWLESIHPDDVTSGLASRAEAFAKREPFQTRFRLRRADGAYRWMHDTGVPRHCVNGTFLGYVGSCIDVTEQKLAQDALERERERLQQTEQALLETDRRKDDFLAMLGHELRNPLAAIAGALEIMRLYGDERAPVLRAREIAERQALQLAGLMDDLLDVARITRGTIALRLEAIDVVEVLKRAIDATQSAVDAKRHKLEIHCEGGLLVEADPARLEQMITNLLSNAVKYTDPGGAIRVAAERANGEISIRIRDSGVGIAPEMLSRIFEPFVQASPALDRSEGGLGMGLTIVSELAKLHRGRIEALSTPGQGSEFVLRLPSAHDSETRTRRGLREPMPERQVKRVLVVDDNVDSAEMVAALLSRWGHETQQAHDGPSALRVMETFRPHVVLLDIGLPDMDGYEVARRLRASERSPRPRIVAVSGYGRDGDRQKSAEAGFDAHLVKPVDFGALEREIALKR